MHWQTDRRTDRQTDRKVHTIYLKAKKDLLSLSLPLSCSHTHTHTQTHNLISISLGSQNFTPIQPIIGKWNKNYHHESVSKLSKCVGTFFLTSICWLFVNLSSCLRGAETFSITTFSLMTLSVTTLSTMRLSITKKYATLNIMTLSRTTLNVYA